MMQKWADYLNVSIHAPVKVRTKISLNALR